MKKDIPRALYEKILRVLPVLTVDLVIVHEGEFLLLKRKNNPFKNTWWIPGGRFRKGEDFERAARRIAKEEVGFDIKIIKLLGVGDMHERRWGILVHSIGVVYMAKPRQENIRLFHVNFAGEELKFHTKINSRLHPFVKKFLREAGF